MKRRTIILLLITLTLNSCIGQERIFEKQKTIDGYAKCDSIADDIDNYKLKCECIEANQLTFPMNTVVSGKIIQNKIKEHGSFVKGNTFEIDSVFINSFKSITSDTLNFDWGEIGTTYIDYNIEFYDSNGIMINQANISYDGMLWTIPNLGTTKWGLLNSKGEVELKTLMNKYTKNKKN